MGITVGSSIGIVLCKQITVTNTVSAGIGVKFLGIDLPGVKREISKKTYSAYQPKVKACQLDS